MDPELIKAVGKIVAEQISAQLGETTTLNPLTLFGLLSTIVLMMAGSVAWILRYTIKTGIPSIIKRHQEEQAQQRKDFIEELVEARKDYIELTDKQRQNCEKEHERHKATLDQFMLVFDKQFKRAFPHEQPKPPGH